MKVSILCIGDELLKGVTVNTNASFLGEELLKLGIVPECSMVVPDDADLLKMALSTMLKCSDIVLTTGGLGPTDDDMTRAIISDFLNKKLIHDQLAEDNVVSYWKRRMRLGDIPARVMTQAMVIEGADVVYNDNGTAPGMYISLEGEYSGKKIAMMPGVPREMKPMFSDKILPKIESEISEITFNKIFYVCGVPESLVEERMTDIINNHPKLSVAYCASFEGVKLFLRSSDKQVVESAAKQSIKEFKANILPENCIDLAEDLVRIFLERKETISLAESCTGGKIASRITDVSGSSSIFPGSFVVYSNEWKNKFLKVKSETLEKYGAVSEETVTELIENLALEYHTTASIAVSGIAGPTGGTPDKPVGLVYVGVKYRDKISVIKHNFPGSRSTVRDRVVATSLNTLRLMMVNAK